MDEQKKQKVMIAVLAAVVLGAGASFFAFRDSGASKAEAVKSGPVARRVVEPSETESKSARRVRTTRSRADKPKAPVIRRQRDEVEVKTAERRKQGRKDRKRKKKEAPAPAA